MSDNDHSSAAASRPHRPSGDPEPPQDPPSRPSLWARLRALLPGRAPTLRSDLQLALETGGSAEESDFTPGERAMIQNVLKLAETRVDDVMVPRADVVAIETGETMAHLIARLRQAGHSRLPVYDETLDDIVGMIHIKDVLHRLTALNGNGRAAADKPANGERNGTPAVKLLSPVLRQKIGKLDLVRRVLFVPPSMPVTDLLQQMQATRVHMAIVVDEYGGTDGLVTIEDLLEVVVGEIEDEHDEGDPVMVRRVDDDTFIADARAELGELAETIGPDFDPGEVGEDVDTLGGLVFSLIDRVPVRGEVIAAMKGFEFEVLSADARRVRRVRIVRRRRPVMVRAVRPETAGAPGVPYAPPDEALATAPREAPKDTLVDTPRDTPPDTAEAEDGGKAAAG